MVTLTERLEKDLLLADMDYTPKGFLLHWVPYATLFAGLVGVNVFFLLKGSPLQWLLPLPAIGIAWLFGMWVASLIPRATSERIGRAIEADIFWPSRMLITLLESGNSLLTAFDRVSKTRTISGNYFGKIAAEIYLGKNLVDAVEDAIRYTPSRSFRRVLEPVKNSLRTGAPIEKSLLATLQDLTDEKVVEIEQYEKRLAPVSMFYMIFGTILPTVAVIGLIVLFSVAGITITFFPFLTLLLLVIIALQLVFFNVFKSIRPLVKL